MTTRPNPPNAVWVEYVTPKPLPKGQRARIQKSLTEGEMTAYDSRVSAAMKAFEALPFEQRRMTIQAKEQMARTGAPGSLPVDPAGRSTPPLPKDQHRQIS